MAMKLIVGLGNPGRLYANNRHNVGFQCLNWFARSQGISLAQRRARARLGVGEIAGAKVILAKPRTFMNLSGQAVAALVAKFGVSPADLLVIYDDLDLPLGKIRIRQRGGSGGHNGMKSIIAHLGSRDFPRIRVGIAPLQEDEATAIPKEATKTPEYVLSDFTPQEKPVIKEVCAKVADAISCLLTEGIAAAMNKYN